jgi:cytochrome c556
LRRRIKAIDVKDAVAAKAAFGAMTKACKSCHDFHKPKT